MPQLLVNPGTSAQWEIQLKPGPNSLGRGEQNDFQIADASVSGSHCRITVVNGSVTVTDLGSSNGTFINGAPVTEAPLKPGEQLQLGNVALQLAVPAAKPVPVRVRIAREEPPLAPPVPGGAPATTPVGPSMCKFHPRTPAPWYCAPCQKAYCDLCVNTRPGGLHKYCRICGNECAPLEVQLLSATQVSDLTVSFYSRLPGAFAYPFQGTGLMMLIFGTIFFVAADFAGSYSLWIRIVFVGYLFAWMQNVIQTTAQDPAAPVSWPDVTDFWGDILIPCLQLCGIGIVCFGPAIGFSVWGVSSGSPMITVLFIPAVVLGCLYLPMALLGVAMFDSVAALNPMLIFPAIGRVPLEYLIACVVLGLAVGVRFAAAWALAFIDMPIVPQLVSGFVGLYFLTAEMRMLGLLYKTKRDRFGWFPS